MIVDKNGKSVVFRKTEQQIRISKVKDFLKKKGIVLAMAVGFIAVVIGNLTTIINFYEKVTDGPIIEIPIEVSNARKEPIQITSLLDLHITATQFYSARLSELPTARLSLNTKRKVFPYTIRAGETAKFSIDLHERRYKNELSSGGLDIIFVLHLEDSDEVYYFIEPFHKDVLSSVNFGYTVE